MRIDTFFPEPKRVEKEWGHELWIHNSPLYCGKLLVFRERGARFSLHYHLKKTETWYVQQGFFTFRWVDLERGKLMQKEIFPGDVIEIPQGLPHQLIAQAKESTVFEVSTQHFDDDSYRIYKYDFTDHSEAVYMDEVE